MRHLALAGLLVSLLFAACAANRPATVFDIGMQGMAFTQNAVSVKSGEAVRLNVKNSDATTHDFTVEKIPADGIKAIDASSMGHDMMGMGNYTLHVAVDAGKTGQLDFRPTQPGDYEFFCTVPGHREAGMHGTIHVG